jgi:polysaccharide biosynthesis/export protein
MRMTFFLAFGVAGLLSGVPSAAQQRLDSTTIAPPQAGGAPPTGTVPFGGYLIGIGDILNIRIAEEDDISGRYQVSQAGDIHLPLLSDPIRASGRTTFELSKQLGDALRKQDILKEPFVTVFIERGMTQNVTVNGPVARPGIYPIERPTHLLDVLSMSGGLLPTAGQTITIVRHADTNGTAAQSANGGTASVDVATLMSGDNRDANVLVEAGDQITVANATVVYVVGAVTRPGAFAVQDPKNGMTVLRAIALVEGTLPTASLGKTIIVRRSSDESNREEIPIDLGKIMKGKQKDPTLLANDILFVPQSGFKQGMRKMGDVAAAAAGQVAGYGLGLRIAH